MKDKCQVKGCNETQNLHEHHIFWKCLAWDKKETGIVFTMCKKCHDKLHERITPVLVKLTRDFIERGGD